MTRIPAEDIASWEIPAREMVGDTVGILVQDGTGSEGEELEVLLLGGRGRAKAEKAGQRKSRNSHWRSLRVVQWVDREIYPIAPGIAKIRRATTAESAGGALICSMCTWASRWRC